mgnify:CR=1 FL=1
MIILIQDHIKIELGLGLRHNQKYWIKEKRLLKIFEHLKKNILMKKMFQGHLIGQVGGYCLMKLNFG